MTSLGRLTPPFQVGQLPPFMIITVEGGNKSTLCRGCFPTVIDQWTEEEPGVSLLKLVRDISIRGFQLDPHQFVYGGRSITSIAPSLTAVCEHCKTGVPNALGVRGGPIISLGRLTPPFDLSQLPRYVVIKDSGGFETELCSDCFKLIITQEVPGHLLPVSVSEVCALGYQLEPQQFEYHNRFLSAIRRSDEPHCFVCGLGQWSHWPREAPEPYTPSCFNSHCGCHF